VPIPGVVAADLVVVQPGLALEAAQQSLEEGGVQVEVEATKGLRR
jgi:hypothetical protein